MRIQHDKKKFCEKVKNPTMYREYREFRIIFITSSEMTSKH